MTLKERLVAAGYDEKEMFHHYSDLYVYVTTVTTKVIEEYYLETGYRKEHFVETFRDNITGKLMYDCAFQWYGNN